MIKIKATLLMSAFFVVLQSATAFAQDDIQERMEKAVAMTKEDLMSALNQYLEIRVSAPDNVAVTYSLGRTYQRLYQCDIAQNYYIDVMSVLPESNAVYQRAITAYTEIEGCQNWEQVYFDCEIPIGGYAQIDDNRIKSCWDRPFSLPPGEHVFKVVDADGNAEETTYTTREGVTGEPHHVVLKSKPKEVEKIVEVERDFILKERFHPALYWGLIAGGVAFIAGGGFFSAMANNAQILEQRYADSYALGIEEDKKKSTDQHDKVKLGNTLSYTFVGIGSAVVISGVVLAIISAVSDKEREEVSPVNAYVSPSADGISLGMGLQF